MLAYHRPVGRRDHSIGARSAHSVTIMLAAGDIAAARAADEWPKVQDHRLRCESADQNQSLGAVARFTHHFYVIGQAAGRSRSVSAIPAAS